MKCAAVKAMLVVVALWGVTPAPALGQCCGDCNGNGVVAINELITAVNRALEGCQDDGVCDVSVATCAAQLVECNTSLTNVQANLDSCSGSLATCNAGTATAGDVLIGATFSSSAGLGISGEMPDNGAVSIMPGTTPQSIAAGYHDGLGSVAGDGDLAAVNIKLGVDLFGVTGELGCGNGVIDEGEQCDQSTLDGATCVSEGFAFGTLQCGANCALDTSGCYSERFTDNGDGTVTDGQTGLMWEKKGHLGGAPVKCTSAGVCPDPHDADNEYTYSDDNPTGPPGTVFTVMLAQLNAGEGFAGHTDWRLPTLEELRSLVDYADPTNPVTPAPFDIGCNSSCDGITCSCTATDLYWTNDLVTGNSENAWVIDFADGSVLNDTRDTDYHARAVR